MSIAGISPSVPHFGKCMIEVLGDYESGKEAFIYLCEYGDNGPRGPYPALHPQRDRHINWSKSSEYLHLSVFGHKGSCEAVLCETDSITWQLKNRWKLAWMDVATKDVCLFCCRHDDASTLESVRSFWVPEAKNQCSWSRIPGILLRMGCDVLGWDRGEREPAVSEPQVTDEMMDAVLAETGLACWMHVSCSNLRDVVVKAVDLYVEQMELKRQKELERERELRKLYLRRKRRLRRYEVA